MTATFIYLMVLLSGTPNTGYQAQILFRSETLATCEEHVKLWIEAYKDLAAPGVGNRLKCIKINQKLMERYPY